MYAAEVQRSDLVHLGGSRSWKAKFSKLPAAPPRAKQCLLVWLTEEQDVVPDVIVVPDGDIEDFSLGRTRIWLIYGRYQHFFGLSNTRNFVEQSSRPVRTIRSIGGFSPV